MNDLFTFRFLALLGLGALTAMSSTAQEAPHAYGGISVGKSRANTDANGLTSSLLPGATASSSTTDEKDTAYKLFGGYQFNRNLAVEGGYFNLGSNSFQAVTSPAGTLAGSTKAHGLNVDLVGTLPLSDRFSALARVGAQRTWSKSSYSGSAGSTSVAGSSQRSDNGYKAGLGLQYDLSPSMSLRGEVERYRVRNAAGQRTNVNMLSASLAFPF